MSKIDATPPLTLRERTRRAVRESIEDSARELFSRQGYEATTVDQIARAAGMSERSFFRYFASKEDLVMSEMLGLAADVVASFRARPAQEDLWEALGEAFKVFDRLYEHSATSVTSVRHDLIEASPVLSAAFQLGRATLQSELTALARARTTDTDAASLADPRLDAVIGSGLACLEATERAWMHSPPGTQFSDLLDLTMRYFLTGPSSRRIP